MKHLARVPQGFRSPAELAGVAEHTPVAVALSGGADSVALLHMLTTTPAPLHALHIHHGIRGAEADRDADFCRRLCKSLGVPLTVVRLDVPAMARATGEGLETAARNARYGAYEAFLAEHGIPLLATAHHADDQLETMLGHLMRGSGLRGLCGIPASRPLGNAVVTRPLLHLSKTELLAYCKKNALDFVTDSTNEQPCCPRNRLRLAVMPVLHELWEGGAVRAARCATSLAEDEQYLRDVAANFLQTQGGAPSVGALAALPRPIFARVMQALLPTTIHATHIDALQVLVKQGEPHAALSLPGATVRLEEGRLMVCPAQEPPILAYCVTLEQEQVAFPCGIAILTDKDAPVPPGHADRYTHHARIPLANSAIKGTLTVRNRRQGDRILSGGKHKVVRKLSCMTKLSLAQRARLPILCDEDGILALPFGPVRDGASKHSDKILHLFFQ